MAFISGKNESSRNGQRFTGSFFIMWTDIKQERAWGCLRYLTMTQCGQFMMGDAVVCGKNLILSGSYGSDGLGRDAERDDVDTDKLVELPHELYLAWAKGDGWNSSGSEWKSIKKWIANNEKALRKAGR